MHDLNSDPARVLGLARIANSYFTDEPMDLTPLREAGEAIRRHVANGIDAKTVWRWDYLSHAGDGIDASKERIQRLAIAMIGYDTLSPQAQVFLRDHLLGVYHSIAPARLVPTSFPPPDPYVSKDVGSLVQ